MYGMDIHTRIRSIGISNFPLSFVLFCNYSKPFTGRRRRRRIPSFEQRKKDDLQTNDDNDNDDDDDDDNDPIFVRNCLLWSIMQFICVLSGVFDWYYCDVIIKGSIIYFILCERYRIVYNN